MVQEPKASSDAFDQRLEGLLDAIVATQRFNPSTRPLFLEGLPGHVVARLPDHNTIWYQLRSDVACLRDIARTQPNGHVHLARWLRNTERLLAEDPLAAQALGVRRLVEDLRPEGSAGASPGALNDIHSGAEEGRPTAWTVPTITALFLAVTAVLGYLGLPEPQKPIRKDGQGTSASGDTAPAQDPPAATPPLGATPEIEAPTHKSKPDVSADTDRHGGHRDRAVDKSKKRPQRRNASMAPKDATQRKILKDLMPDMGI